MAEQNIKNALELLDQLLSTTNLDDVSADQQGFNELPDGYYLCEVEEAKFTTSKSSGNPMVSFKFKITEDGIAVEYNNDKITLKDIKHTQNRKIFKHYVLKDDSSVRRFASDMLKFEGEVAGEPLLPKEAFTTSDTLIDALDVLTGMRLYVQSDTSEKDDGTKSTWYNLISWKRAKDLELPQ